MISIFRWKSDKLIDFSTKALYTLAHKIDAFNENVLVYKTIGNVHRPLGQNSGTNGGRYQVVSW